jgi:hypothetical protein
VNLGCRIGNGRTAKVTTEHEVEDKETILVILERVAEVDDERVVNLRDTDASILSGASGCEWGLTLSRSLRSWMMFPTAFILTAFILLMYLSAYVARVCLC